MTTCSILAENSGPALTADPLDPECIETFLQSSAA
jgi:hypothetical protein